MSGIKQPFKRLSKSVIPSHYDITLQPDLENFVFTGSETINIAVLKKIHHIKINCLDINITKVVYTPTNGDDIQPRDIKYRSEEETVKFNFEEILPVGDGTLYIEYSGELNDKLKGFYRSAQGSGDDRQYAAVTHFEPTDARRAFPCWDEPAIKCTFDITLIVPTEKVVLSNMNVLDTSASPNSDALKVVKFATTPKMSTYIIAFIVGDFDYVEDKTDKGTIVRVYTSRGKSEQGCYALEVATKTLMFYEQFFNIPYDLPKIDLIGIADFGISAMENWGLVTYRERYLLADASSTAVLTKQKIAEIIGHELAHNWFGNLVTMEWWTDLWLKEGFANFIQYHCVDHIFPEFDIWSQFVFVQDITAKNLDALNNSHPVEVPVGHPSEVIEIFDRISYSKGASILRMLYNYIGEQDFRNGLHEYLKKHQYKNTVTNDLWGELKRVSKKPVDRVMSTWTKQMGFPVVSVTRESIGENRQVLKLKQTKFNVGDQISDGFHWMVPVNITTSRKPDEVSVKVLMADPDMVIYLDNVSQKDWIKLNPGQTDFYRVLYTNEMIQQLIPAIQSKQLSNQDRLGIQNDLFSLAYAGYVPFVNYFELLSAYVDESDYIVWKDIITNMEILSGLMERTDVHKQFKSFVLSLIKPVAERIGIDKAENEGQLNNILRDSIYKLLGTMSESSDVEMFQKLFSDHVDNVADIDVDIRSAVYATVATHGDQQILQNMKELYSKTEIVDEKQRILTELGRFQNAELRREVLEFSISDEVRNQDTIITLFGCLSSHAGRTETWNFIKENWDTYQKRCTGGTARSNLIKNVLSSFATEEEYNDVKEFLSKHPVPVADRAVKQSLENIVHNISLLDRLKQICSIF